MGPATLFAQLLVVYMGSSLVIAVAAVDPTAIVVASMAFVASVISSGAGVYIATQRSRDETRRIIEAGELAAKKISDATLAAERRLAARTSHAATDLAQATEAAAEKIVAAAPAVPTSDDPVPVEVVKTD